jgi:O-antigen/teichoic acid export membrane protein
VKDDGHTDTTPASEPESHSRARRLITRVVPRGRFGRGVAVLVGGTTASQAILALTAPVLTRLYTPTDFGVLGVYTAIVALLGVVVGLRYMVAIPLPKEDSDAVNVVALSLAIGAGMSCALGLLGAALGHPFARFMHVPQLAPYMWLLPLSLLGNCILQTLYLWAIRVQGFSVIARARVSQAVARVGVQSVLGVVGVAPFGLLLGDLAEDVVGSGTFARLISKRRPGAWRSVSLQAMKRLAIRYSRFAWFGTPAGLLNVAGLQGMPLLVAYSYGATVAGWYALTLRVVALPMSLLGAAVGDTYFGIGPELVRTNPAALRSLFKKTAVRLLMIGIGPTVVLMLAGPTLFSFVFGDKWVTAGVYARYLAPAMLAQFVTSPLSDTMIILERPGLQLFTDTLRIALMLGTFLLAHELSWSANTAILLVSLALLLSYIVYFAVYWWLIRRLGGGDRR